MSSSAIHGVMSTVRSCAFAMLANATFIQDELPKVKLDETLRTHVERVCSSLIGTKHDILTELDELGELLASSAAEDAIRSRVDRMVRWLCDDVGQLHELVSALQTAVRRDASFQTANILVLESAANILATFNRAKVAADIYRHRAPGS